MSTPFEVCWNGRVHAEEYDGQPRHVLPLLANLAKLKRRNQCAFYRTLFMGWQFTVSDPSDADYSYILDPKWEKVRIRHEGKSRKVDLLKWRPEHEPGGDSEEGL